MNSAASTRHSPDVICTPPCRKRALRGGRRRSATLTPHTSQWHCHLSRCPGDRQRSDRLAGLVGQRASRGGDRHRDRHWPVPLAQSKRRPSSFMAAAAAASAGTAAPLRHSQPAARRRCGPIHPTDELVDPESIVALARRGHSGVDWTGHAPSAKGSDWATVRL